MSGEDTWITPRLFNSKYNELRSAVICKKGSYDFALGSVDIVL
jgi:hypothetical protein